MGRTGDNGAVGLGVYFLGDAGLCGDWLVVGDSGPGRVIVGLGLVGLAGAGDAGAGDAGAGEAGAGD